MCYNRNIFLGTEDKVMEKSKVYFTDFRTRLGEGLPSKLKRLMKAAGIQDMDMDHKFVAIRCTSVSWVIWDSYVPIMRKR